MSTAAPTVSSSKETTNYARLCRVLVDVGNQVLRDTFNAIHPPANLHTVLAGNKTTLQSLRTRKIINATQWRRLFPAISSSVSSRDFDTTLLMVLLQNLCGLLPPATGWDTLPAVTDVSREADIVRVMYFGNTVYAHAQHASVDDATFITYWQDIRDTLVRLGGVHYIAAIDNLETECMDPEIEDHYKELLNQWKKDEENMKDELKEIGTDIENVVKMLKDLKPGLTKRKKTSDEGTSSDMELSAGRSQKHPDSFSKKVLLLKNSDFERTGDQIKVPNYSEMCNIRAKEGQYKKYVEFHASMSAEMVKRNLEETFPYLKNKRFLCAAKVNLDRKRSLFDFHGKPRLWDGKTIRRRIQGNSILYVLEDYEYQSDTIEISGREQETTEEEFFKWLQQSPSFKVSIRPKESHLEGGYPCVFTFNPKLYPDVTSAHATFENLGTVQLERLKNNDLLGFTPASPVPGLVTITLYSQHGIKLGQTVIKYYGETHQKSMLGSRFFSQPCDQVSKEQDAKPEERHQESMPGNQEFSDFIQWLQQNLSFEVSIRPKESHLQGGVPCRFIFNPKLHPDVTSGHATFENLGTVQLERLKNGDLLGTIPASKAPGLVTTTLYSQHGIKLGQTVIKYYGETHQESMLGSQLFSQASDQISKEQDAKPDVMHQKSMPASLFFPQPSDKIPKEQDANPEETRQETMPGNPLAANESSIVRATMKFEAEHEECLGVYPCVKSGEVVVHLYVHSGKSGIPAGLKSDAEELFGKMGVKPEWFDLYNDTYNVLNVTPIEYPSGKPNRLEASQADEIDKVINKHLHVFSNHRNITAVQPSFKITKSVETEEACITVYVLGKGNIPVGESAIPRTIGSYPVDIVNGFCVRTNNPTKPIEAHEQKEVLCLGASIGVNGEQSSGTLGALVEDVHSGTLYALSCDHVMNHENKSEIIYPGFDIYLNSLHYHLNNYKVLIRRIHIPADHCELPQLSIDIHKNPTELFEKFNELKAIKERNSTRTSAAILKSIREEEEVLEEAFSKPPRTVAKYCAGIRHNVQTKNSGREHFIDTAISVLEEEEQNNLKLGKSITMIGSRHSPNGECIPATTNAIMGVEDLCKSGSATGFTESSRLLGVNLSAPMTIKAFRPQGEHKPWMDYQCINCEKREASQSQAETLSSPCVLCKPDRWLKSCLCIQKPGHRVFSDIGDSGAVIFEMRKEKNGDYETYLPGFGIIFALHTSQHFTFSIASPLEPALEALSQKVTNSRPDRMACKLKLASELRWNT